MAAGSPQRNGRPQLKVVLATPRGFCAGVVRAIKIVERALEKFGPPVYVRHEIVHNQRVVESLAARGVRFVEEIDEIPAGAVTVFSAHGVARSVGEASEARGLEVIDATCPLVDKVHKEGQRYADKGFEVVLIGHRGHPEVEGTMGRIAGTVLLVSTVEDVAMLAPADPGRLAYVTQTTLSVDDTRDVIAALKDRFPAIVGPDVRDICYATQNRQTAARALAAEVDVMLVVGAANSSNSNRLREISEAAGIPSFLLPDALALDTQWLDGASSVGITAGASAPEELVDELVARLRTLYDVDLVEAEGVAETVRFRMPPELEDAAMRGPRSFADGHR